MGGRTVLMEFPERFRGELFGVSGIAYHSVDQPRELGIVGGKERIEALVVGFHRSGHGRHIIAEFHTA
jgi:hypothetical protein